MPALRYRAEPLSMRLVHPLGPMTLVYHRRSGITHMLSDPVPQILEALGAMGEGDAAAVAAHLATIFDLSAEDASAEVTIAARLDELVALGVVGLVP